MGASSSQPSQILANNTKDIQVLNTDNDVNKIIFVPRERIRHGVVNVKISSITVTNRGRPQDENNQEYTVTPKGAIFYGSLAQPALIKRGIANCGIPMLEPAEHPLNDSRAHKLLVIHTNSWYVVPSPEPFSRHSGTCLILGDKKSSSGAYKIKLGDCFRLGSVGVVVSEIKYTTNGDEDRLDARKLQYLKDDALAFDTEEDFAALAADEERLANENNNVDHGCAVGTPSIDSVDKIKRRDQYLDETVVDNAPLSSPIILPDTNISSDNAGADNNGTLSLKTPEKCQQEAEVNEGVNLSRTIFNDGNVYGSGGITNGERFVCYMCYETHDTPSDPLVAPCDCKGDTRYLHVQCLQKWYQSSVAGPQARVIRTTCTGAPACKICGSAYKTTFKRADGKRANLLETECPGPYISFVVVTRHDTNPGLFNTKFRLNFGAVGTAIDHLQDFGGFSNTLTIGRSSNCNMVLDYRTVSTVHAKVSFEDGEFYIHDRESSNGTMVYLQKPFKLKYSSNIRVRMGRTTMQFQAKRSWTAALRSTISANFPFVSSNHDSNDNIISADAITSDGVIVGKSYHTHLRNNENLENIASHQRSHASPQGIKLSRSVNRSNINFPRVLNEDELVMIMSENSVFHSHRSSDAFCDTNRVTSTRVGIRTNVSSPNVSMSDFNAENNSSVYFDSDTSVNSSRIRRNNPAASSSAVNTNTLSRQQHRNSHGHRIRTPSANSPTIVNLSSDNLNPSVHNESMSSNEGMSSLNVTSAILNETSSPEGSLKDSRQGSFADVVDDGLTIESEYSKPLNASNVPTNVKSSGLMRQTTTTVMELDDAQVADFISFRRQISSQLSTTNYPASTETIEMSSPAAKSSVDESHSLDNSSGDSSFPSSTDTLKKSPDTVPASGYSITPTYVSSSITTEISTTSITSTLPSSMYSSIPTSDIPVRATVNNTVVINDDVDKELGLLVDRNDDRYTNRNEGDTDVSQDHYKIDHKEDLRTNKKLYRIDNRKDDDINPYSNTQFDIMMAPPANAFSAQSRPSSGQGR